MSGNDDWEIELEKSQLEFSKTDVAKNSKEKIYDALMSKMARSGDPIMPFSEAEQLVNNMAKEKAQPKGKPSVDIKARQYLRRGSNIKKINQFVIGAGGFAAVAALFVIIFVNLNSTPPPVLVNSVAFDPPLSMENMPPAMVDKSLQFRTLASNNTFYLAYLDDTKEKDQVQLLIHSRSGKVDWDRLFVVDEDDDMVTPIEVDAETGMVCLPVSGLDVTLEVVDEKGNAMECTFPADLEPK